jgi:hypothetical protein
MTSCLTETAQVAVFFVPDVWFGWHKRAKRFNVKKY